MNCSLGNGLLEKDPGRGVESPDGEVHTSIFGSLEREDFIRSIAAIVAQGPRF
jgi:hypothetical protein